MESQWDRLQDEIALCFLCEKRFPRIQMGSTGIIT